MIWWAWVILGLVLIATELFHTLFLLLGIGTTAIVVGVIDYFYPINLKWQLIWWAFLSVIYILIWIRFIKKSQGSKVGQSDSGIGKIGVVIRDIKPPYKGEVEFDEPVYGSRFWKAEAKEFIPKGTKVEVIGIVQQTLKVEVAKEE